MLYPFLRLYLAIAVQIGAQAAMPAHPAAGIIYQQGFHQHPQGMFLRPCEDNAPVLADIKILVEFHDQEKDNELVFLTNNFYVSAMEVACLYKNRWQLDSYLHIHNSRICKTFDQKYTLYL